MKLGLISETSIFERKTYNWTTVVHIYRQGIELVVFFKILRTNTSIKHFYPTISLSLKPYPLDGIKTVG